MFDPPISKAFSPTQNDPGERLYCSEPDEKAMRSTVKATTSYPSKQTDVRTQKANY